MGALPRRLTRELLTATVIVLAAVLLILLSGQLVQIGDLLLTAGPRAPWAAAIGAGLAILLEAALPLTGLVAAGLVYGRLRAEGGWVASAAVGQRPEPLLLPALALGIVLGAGATYLAHGPVPRAVAGLRVTLLDAAAAALAVADRPLALPGGGVARRIDGDRVWAALPASGGPLLVRAADVKLRVEDALAPASPGAQGSNGQGSNGQGSNGQGSNGQGIAHLILTDAQIWGSAARIQVREAHLTVPVERLARRLRMLGPPNALTTAALDPGDVHHRFTAHRRSALPAMAPLWALLGALLGARFGGPGAVAIGAGTVAFAYWFLRTGELSARAGFMSPALAAWAPLALLAAGLLWAWIRSPTLVRATR